MHQHADLPTIIFKDMGTMPYADAFEIQMKAHQQVLDGQRPNTILFFEHPPVITISQRQSAPKNLLTPRDKLAELGIDVQSTNRGGDITYHGPGQLVAYPILNLQPMHLNIGRYMRLLEKIVIETLDIFDIPSTTIPDCTGVWVTENTPENTPLKICAMGIRVRKLVTLHGLAINVNPDLSHFNHIIPCGLPDKGVTSMHQLLPEKDRPAIVEVKVELAQKFVQHFEPLLTHEDDTTP